MITVPAGLVRTTTSREGDPGSRWLAELPSTVEDLLDRWGCTVDGPPTSGAVAIVVPVRWHDAPAVLKVSFPHPGNRSEPGALRVFGGRGAVRLLDADETAFAMLLERAGPQALDTVAVPEEAIEIAGALARRLAVPAPLGTPTLAAMSASWLQELDAQVHATPGALPPSVLDRARETMRTLGADTADTMVHGDLHHGNVLAADREPWLAIDPKGWRGTAAWDAFTVAAGKPEPLLVAPDPEQAFRDRVERFSRAARVDADLALACAQARATSSALHERLHGGDPGTIALLDRVASLR